MFTLAAASLVSLSWLVAQDAPRFTRVQPLNNKEIALTLSVSNGLRHRVETSTNLSAWSALVTLPGAVSSITHTDSAAPYLSERYYRAEQLTGTNFLTGDHLATTNGDVIIHPMFHATFVMSWNGRIIYNDPDDDSAYLATYQGLPKADLILISHSHGDHYSSSQIAAVRGSNVVIIVPQDVYNQSSFAPFRTNAIVLSYGASTNILDLTVQAVPGYNGNHPIPINNAYVVTLGGKRILTSGDTGNVPEIRALTDIDVAFLCMNRPFTMTVSEATNSVRAFRPKVVYPYHYRDSSTFGSATTNAAHFKQALGADLGIEVRLRKWY